MNGVKLYTAARIIAKAGEQIDVLMNILIDKLIVVLKDEKQKIRAENRDHDEIDSAGDWLIESYLEDIALLKGRSTKPYAHLAIQAVLYDEVEANIPGWEPSIYIEYSPGEMAFNLGDDSFWISDTLDEENEYQLDKNCRLWLWETYDKGDSWAFCIPFVKLNSEESLVEQIVVPVKKLLEGIAASAAFPSNSVAFQFSKGNNGVSILV